MGMPQSVRRYSSLFLALLCLTTVLPGLFLSFEDSEIWGITSSRRLIDQPFEITSAHYKPLFSLIFGSVVSLSSSDWTALIASRWVTMIFAAAGLFSFYSLGLKLLDRHRPIYFTGIFYAIFATMPLMILHFTKARSDTISASIVFVGGFTLLCLKRRPLYVTGLTYCCAGLAALMITPKSIDLLVVLMLIFWFITPAASTLRRTLWMTGPLVVPLLAGLVLTRELIVRSIIYWIDTYQGLQFFSWVNWVSITRSLQAAPVVSLVVGSGLAIGIVQCRKLDRNERLLVAIGAAVCLFIVIHSQKYLFFLASRAPFLAVGALPGFHLLIESIARRCDDKTVLRGLLAAFSLSLAIAFAKIEQFPVFEMRYQRAVLESLSAYLDRAHSGPYWDAIGLFPKRNSIFHFPSPGDRTNSDLLDYVDRSRPTLILRTSKMELLEPQFMLWLRSRYFAINEQVYVRFHMIPKSESCQLTADEVLKILALEHFNFPIGLFVRTSNLGGWMRTSFFSKSGLEHQTLDDKTLSQSKIELRECARPDVSYAIVEDGPWSAMPAPNFTPFFGYDGRL